MPEADALVRHLELAAHLAEHVQERDHLRLGRALDEDVAVRGKRGGRPGRGLDTVGQRRVRVALQLLDAFNAEGAVHVHGNNRAHLLQHAYQIHDLRLGGRARQFGLALGQHGRQQRLLGGAHRRVGQVDLRSMQAVGRGDVDAVLVLLVHRGAQLAQRLQMEVDRAPADRAAAQCRNERLAQTVHERAGEQDRDARGARQRVHVSHIGQLNMRGIDSHNALFAVHIHVHAMQAQQIGHHMYVTDLRHVLQHRLARRQQRGDHRFAHEVLRAAHLNRASQRLAAFNMQHVIRVLSHATLLNQSRFKNATVQFAISHVPTP